MAKVTMAVPVLPAANVLDSLAWWVGVCGFQESFRDAEPPRYAGVTRDGVHLHLAGMSDAGLARVVGDQTMLRVVVEDLDAFYAEFRERSGAVHPNSPAGVIVTKPWGSREFAALDPNGVCVSFVSD